MKKTLSRYGNSLALIIDKPILELLKIKDDTVLTITTDGNQLIITPEHVEGSIKNKITTDSRLRKAIEEVFEDYADTFKRLADN